MDAFPEDLRLKLLTLLLLAWLIDVSLMLLLCLGSNLVGCLSFDSFLEPGVLCTDLTDCLLWPIVYCSLIVLKGTVKCCKCASELLLCFINWSWSLREDLTASLVFLTIGSWNLVRKPVVPKAETESVSSSSKDCCPDSMYLFFSLVSNWTGALSWDAFLCFFATYCLNCSN